jgi:hypothetical protein
MAYSERAGALDLALLGPDFLVVPDSQVLCYFAVSEILEILLSVLVVGAKPPAVFVPVDAHSSSQPLFFNRSARIPGP